MEKTHPFFLSSVFQNEYELVSPTPYIFRANGHFYNCTKINEKTKLAVKLMETQNINSLQEQISEIKQLKSLNHKNIVQMVGYKLYSYLNINDEQMDVVAIIFEKGQTDLENYLIKMNSPMIITDLLKFAKEMTQAMLHANNQNIIHQDLQTKNIQVFLNKQLQYFITFNYFERSQQPTFKIADFGTSNAQSFDSFSSEITNEEALVSFNPETCFALITLNAKNANISVTQQKCNIFDMGLIFLRCMGAAQGFRI